AISVGPRRARRRRTARLGERSISMVRRVVLLAPLLVAALWAVAAAPPAKPVPSIDLFFKAASPDVSTADAALAAIAYGCTDGYGGMIVDAASLMQRTALGNTFSLIRFLEAQTRQKFGSSLSRWREWLWSLPYDPHPGYGPFKGALYALIDPRFADFF